MKQSKARGKARQFNVCILRATLVSIEFLVSNLSAHDFRLTMQCQYRSGLTAQQTLNVYPSWGRKRNSILPS